MAFFLKRVDSSAEAVGVNYSASNVYMSNRFENTVKMNRECLQTFFFARIDFL